MEKIDSNGSFFQEKDGNNLWQIFDKDGVQLEIYSYDCIRGSETPFLWFGKDRILASKDGKFGFVSISGIITIPLKYDEIEPREDGLFDVRIDKAWGLLHLDGYEVITIKYSKRLPLDYSDAIVIDANTGKCGMLNSLGIEKIPCIYDNLFLSNNKKYIFYGYGTGFSEYLDTNIGNFKYDVMWGCMDIDGIELIEPKYSCFILYDGFLLAGRNHSYPLVISNSTNCLRIEELHDYNGLFDLYDDSFHLVIGGFNDFEYNKENGVFLFQFGVYSKYESGGEDGEGVYHPSYYTYDYSNSQWLVLRKDLSCVLKPNKKWGKIPPGFIVTAKRDERPITRPDFCTRFGLSQHDVIISYEWNIPMEILTKEKPQIIENIVICKDNQEKYAVRIEDGTKSQKYSNIHVVGKDFFFVLKEQPQGQSNFIGISTFKKETFMRGYVENVVLYCTTNLIYLFTYPVLGYFFCVKKLDEKNSSVLLYNLSTMDKFPIVAISSIDTEILLSAVAKGKLKFWICNYHELKTGEPYNPEPKTNISISDIYLYHEEIFDEGFVRQTAGKKSELFNKDIERYWFPDETITLTDNISIGKNEYHHDYLLEFHYPDDSPYYNPALDMDQQSPEFWDSI